MLENKLYAHLSTSTNLTVTSSVSTRIYPIMPPELVQTPFITYQRISGGQENDLSGYSIMENPRIQIDIFANTYKEAKSISTYMHTILAGATGFKALLISDMDLYEDDVEFYRVSQDYSCWNKE